MAEKTTIARPYAEAIFEMAKEQQNLAKWSEMLALIELVVSSPEVQGLIGNPRIQKSQLATLILDVSGSNLNKEAQNFVRLLISNNRLNVVPEIFELFQIYRAEAESTVTAEVTSAFPMSPEQEKMIANALKKRLNREVMLTSRVDKSLLGGVVVRAGDLVIDGSVVGQLEKLNAALTR